MPRSRICHPWPWDRLHARIRAKSRVRKYRPLGSVRGGGGGNPGPSRDLTNNNFRPQSIKQLGQKFVKRLGFTL